jgi:signal peptidase II
MTAYPRSRICVYAVITIVALAVDLVSKSVVFARLRGPFQRSGWLIDTWLKFEFHTSLNRGALWGMGQGMAPAFALLSVAALIGINYWLFFRGAARSLWLTTALSLVSGGALGNLYDRLGLHGVSFPGEDHAALAVRDFLHFQFGSFDYPIFNIADSFLVTGAIMLMIQSMKEESPPKLQDSAEHSQTPGAQ